MKKTALTIGLFSLVVVATSFANSTTPSIVSNEKSNIVWPTEGTGATGGQKKRDFHAINVDKKLNFSSVNQVIGTDKKVD